MPAAHVCNGLRRAFSSAAAKGLKAESVTADVVCIGSGIIGASIGLELSRRGHKVIVVDKLSGAGMGSTAYSSGICRMFYSVPDSVKFSWEGYQYYKNWDDHIQVIDPEGMQNCASAVG